MPSCITVLKFCFSLKVSYRFVYMFADRLRTQLGNQNNRLFYLNPGSQSVAILLIDYEK